MAALHPPKRGISAIKCKKEKRKHGKQKSVVKNAMDSYLGFSQRISSNSPCTPPTLYWEGRALGL